ncbi:hypothetical protein [Cytobacillus pseudoceanisediminis]|uniref:hypothetical protein n=1 Tax=Cytobacillus pseudoceanisediminis TaxID=3051614 RepID=UPI003C2DDBB4
MDTNLHHSLDSFLPVNPDFLEKTKKELENIRMEFSFSLVESMIEHISEPKQPKKELFQLLNQLISYFNNEIAMAISISKVFLDDDTCDPRITAYYTEHAICRIMSAWDYLFIILSKHLDSDLLADYRLREDIVHFSIFDYKVIQTQTGARILSQPFQVNKTKMIKPLKRRMGVVLPFKKDREYTLFKDLKQRFSYNDRVKQIFNDYYLPSVEELKRIRFNSLHKNPLGFRVKQVLMDETDTNIPTVDWIDDGQLDFLISDNLFILKNALQTLFEISILGDLSVNTANQQNKFHSYMVSCNHCYQRSMISDELMEFMDTNDIKPICLGCKSEDLDTGSKVPMSEKVYYERYFTYFKEWLDYFIR